MFGKTFAGLGFKMGQSLFQQNRFRYSTAVCHIETQFNYMRLNPLANNVMLENLREILLSKREVVDLELVDLTSMNQVISLILRGNQPSHVGTLIAKCQDPI